MNYLTYVTENSNCTVSFHFRGHTHNFFFAPSLYLLSYFRFFLVFTSDFQGKTYKEHCNTNKAAAVARGGGEVDT